MNEGRGCISGASIPINADADEEKAVNQRDSHLPAKGTRICLSFSVRFL
jgi:hypothetical protein